ncbi:FprA family A-type flavoprotein [Caldisphaera sp.]|uniref:FprA family A-type flavoprotein n=1 Tax=Caldisphaera sp. TaxID=2060322 RepID=UPI0025C1AC6A|nr:FprA family A-type flavoprotein [Caldisphaera sp.]
MENYNNIIKLDEGIYWIGVNDYKKKMFENMWPIPEGISYNAYLVDTGNGYVVIDGVEEYFTDVYLDKIKRVVKNFDNIKYIIVNHLEPDHQGSLETLSKLTNSAKIIISFVGSKMIKDFYDIPEEKIIAVKDNDIFDFGNRSFMFIHTPWLHWPETMLTLEKNSGILFTCDVFGSYAGFKDGIFDDQVDIKYYVDEAKRYYINIVGRYTKNTLDALSKIEKIRKLIKIIAPAHGIIYRHNIDLPISLYYDWAKPKFEKEVSILYISMYGHTIKLVDIIKKNLESKGVKVKLIDTSETHVSYILSETNNSGAIIFAFPTYDSSIPMPLNNVIYSYQVKMFGRDRPAGIVTGYGWGPIAKQTAELLAKSGFKIIEPLVTVKSKIKQEDIDKLNELSDKIEESLSKVISK